MDVGSDFTEIKSRIDALNGRDQFLEIIRFLDDKELDFELSVKLAKAYVNAFNQNATYEDRDLLEWANRILDSFALEGKDDTDWLFTKGYVLFKQDLIEDAKIRFERALHFIHANNPSEQKLFGTINNMLELCNVLESNVESKNQNSVNLSIYQEHLEKHFGLTRVLRTFGGVDLLMIDKLYDHSYKLLATKGLLCKKFTINDDAAQAGGGSAPSSQGFSDTDLNGGKVRASGYKSQAVELCMAVPAAFDPEAQEEKFPYQVKIFYDLISFILKSKFYVGFGFSFDMGNSIDQATKFQGAMLTAPGDFKPEFSTIVTPDNTLVNMLQIVPLYAQELDYRNNHSAGELLDLFKLRKVNLSPTLEGRPCVCEAVDAGKVE